MAATTFSGPVKIGDQREGSTANTGYTVVTQYGTHVQNSTTAVDTVFYLPANAQILDAYFETATAWNSGTSATGSIGITSGGTEYGGSVDLKATAGRLRPTFTGAQLTAMLNIGTNTTVYFTSTISGATSAGTGRCVLVYAVK